MTAAGGTNLNSTHSWEEPTVFLRDLFFPPLISKGLRTNEIIGSWKRVNLKQEHFFQGKSPLSQSSAFSVLKHLLFPHWGFSFTWVKGKYQLSYRESACQCDEMKRQWPDRAGTEHLWFLPAHEPGKPNAISRRAARSRRPTETPFMQHPVKSHNCLWQNIMDANGFHCFKKQKDKFLEEKSASRAIKLRIA